MRLKKFVRFLWNRLDKFDKYFISTGLIVAILVFIIGILYPNILNSQLEWISKAFSVPITKDKFFSIDASDIVFFFIIFIIILIWPIDKLIRSRFKNNK